MIMSYIYDRLLDGLKKRKACPGDGIKFKSVKLSFDSFRLRNSDMLYVLKELEREGKIRIEGNRIIILR